MTKDLLEGNLNITTFQQSAFSGAMNSVPVPASPTERGLISTVQYKLEDLINRLDEVNTDLSKIYINIFGNDLKNIDGENSPNPNCKPPQPSPNICIINQFRDVNTLLDSINDTINNLDKSL